MTVKIELPADLTPDMEVLFVNPYDPVEMRILHFSGASSRDLAALFHRAQRRDPDFANFRSTLGKLATRHGANGFMVGDDLVILYGARDGLEKIRGEIKNDYNCFFDKMADFLEHLKGRDAVVTIAAPKPVLN